MDNKVKKTIEKTIGDNHLIEKGDHIVLGLSGGPDSVCLFSVLYELAEEMGFTMEAVHVNHMFRPGAAEEDAEYVGRLCDKYGILCRQYKVDCIAKAKDEGKTSEEAGRDARYEAFADAASMSEGPVKIAVAQNAEDQCETMLFRLIRGTGPDGLAAMAYSRRSEGGYDIIRPLLDVRRADIIDYCNAKQLDPRTDHTNAERTYARNRIRLDLIPYIEENFSSKVTDSLLRLSEILLEDKNYFREKTIEALEEIREGEGVSAAGLAELHKSISSRVIMRLAKEAGLKEDLANAHIEEILHISKENITSLKTDLPQGYEAVVRYGVLKIAKKGMKKKAGETLMKASFDKEKLMKAFGTDQITVRTRQPGDYIRLPKGSKKIKKLLIDLKIPQDMRDTVKLACIGKEVLWVAGYRYSAQYKVDENTKEVIEVEIFV